ncbi:DUF11 domain-containing protein [Paucibacter sp. O1-1]|nr:DUF11 domain-containing protein [Paucibacter sp. O1-1]MDA3825304.1 DUF11 domain-containing protein [Paucibacter sp. O1-1]
MPLPDVALTITDNRTRAAVGRPVNYIISVTNSAGPGSATAVVTDALPAGLFNGSWVCIPFGGATCADGNGNTLSDTITLPVGAQVAYVYSATAIYGDANDQIINTASVALTNGPDPAPANNSATDTDLLVLFKDGFDGTPLMVPLQVGTGDAHVAATLRIDATLLNRLSMVPTAVASGSAASGRTLFTLELARFGNDIVLRPDHEQSRLERDFGLAERRRRQSPLAHVRLAISFRPEW